MLSYKNLRWAIIAAVLVLVSAKTVESDLGRLPSLAWPVEGKAFKMPYRGTVDAFRSIVKLEHLPDDIHLSMVTVVLHAMTPHHLALLEQELSSDLEDVSAFDDIPLADRQFILAAKRARRNRASGLRLLHRFQLRDVVVQFRLSSSPLRGFKLTLIKLRLSCFNAFADRGDLPSGPGDGRDVFHVFGTFHADVQRHDHAEALEERAAGLGVDGERTAGFELVEGDQLWVAASDDDDAGGDWNGEVLLHGDVVTDGFEVGLTSTTIKMANEDYELASVRGGSLVVELAEGHGRAVGGVYGDVVGGGESSAVGALVCYGVVLVIGAESCKPLFRIHHVHVASGVFCLLVFEFMVVLEFAGGTTTSTSTACS